MSNAARIYVGSTRVPHGFGYWFSTFRSGRPPSSCVVRQQQQPQQPPPPTGTAGRALLQRQQRQQASPKSENILSAGKREAERRKYILRKEPQQTKTEKIPSVSPEKHFFQDAFAREGTLQYTKVSEQGGPDALFSECLDHLRQQRYDLDPDVDTEPSAAIEKLTQDEREIIMKVLQRVDPEREVCPRLQTRSWYIDPFWDPFKRVEDLQQEVAHDLTEFARSGSYEAAFAICSGMHKTEAIIVESTCILPLVGATEARRQRLLLRASLRRHYRLHDPLSKSYRRVVGSTRSDQFPSPHRVHERFWDPTVDIRVALKNSNVPLSWRDLHVLHHFVGENGLILPRRTTHASRYQQQCIFKAISMARRMALFPYDWKPTPGELMPIMDPLQYLSDELTARYVASGDLRAEAMIRVMLSWYPKLNYSRYLHAKALRTKRKCEECGRREQGRADFSAMLRVYKSGGFTGNVDRPW